MSHSHRNNRKYLRISSDDRKKGDDPSSFTINLGRKPVDKAHSISLVRFQMPNLLPNVPTWRNKFCVGWNTVDITTGVNDTVVYQVEGGVPTSIILTQASYSKAAFALELETQLNASIGGFPVVTVAAGVTTVNFNSSGPIRFIGSGTTARNELGMIDDPAYDMPVINPNTDEEKFQTVFASPQHAYRKCFEIPTGFYSAANLVTVLQNAVNAELVADALTIQFANQVDVPSPIPQDTRFVFETTTTNLAYLSEADGNPMAPLLGLITTSDYTLNHAADGLQQLFGPKVVSLHMRSANKANTQISDGVGSISIHAEIPMTAAYGLLLNYEAQSVDYWETHLNPDARHLQDLHFSIRDERGNKLDTSSSPWSALFMIRTTQ